MAGGELKVARGRLTVCGATRDEVGTSSTFEHAQRYQTQFHPHSQTYALSIVPDYLEREMALVTREDAAGRGCPFCAELRAEAAGLDSTAGPFGFGRAG